MAAESVFFDHPQVLKSDAFQPILCSLSRDEKAQGSKSDGQDRTPKSANSNPPLNKDLEKDTSAATKEVARRLIEQLNKAGSKSADVWDAELSKPEATPQLVAEAVFQLDTKKQHDLAVQGLESAIRNDLIEPWIYNVLAYEMKLAGRPASDIARVLDSRIDFSATDLPQLLMSAAMLSRFEAWDEAIVSCREATKLVPESEDAWLLARSIADKSKNPQHRVWARCGILRHLWGSDHQLQHEEALKAVTDILAALDRAGKSTDAEQIREQFSDAKAVDLRINLTWIGPADLDLLVKEPGGAECSYRNRATSNGGRLIREEGVGDEKAASAKHTERYVCPIAPNGDYELSVRFVLGKAVGGTAILEVIENAGTAAEKKTSRTIKLERKDVTSKLTLTTGRRK